MGEIKPPYSFYRGECMIQIDMKMPESCNKCNFRIFEEGWGDYCVVNQKLLGLFELNKRKDSCPLKEVNNYGKN